VSPADAELVTLAAVLPVATGAVMLWLRRDERWLSEAATERAFHPATRDGAGLLVLLIGPLAGALAIALHYLKTRTGWRRAVYPFAGALGYYAVIMLVLVVVSICLGQDLDL
jgi:uncharacterized membrane protein YidH (DUF202 family)